MKLILLTLFIAGLSAPALALNICTMTFNSSDEKNVLKSVYPSSSHNHIELVPDNKDPDWFRSACSSGVTCDVLLVSGHFGGIFFGEKNSSILSLDELEKVSCQRSCDGILKAKQVYLMGCNTLATKTPDHRSISQYLKVLVQDGFPRNLAEDVVASRYVNYGLSISERMSIAFNNSQDVFGFSSTGPLGRAAAPHLKRALLDSSSIPLKNRLRSAFAGTSFSSINPSSEISSHDRNLQCGTRSQNSYERSEAYREIVTDEQIRKHFDLILRNIDQPSTQASLRQLSSGATRTRIETLANSVLSHSDILIGARFQVLKLLRVMGTLNEEQYHTKTSLSLDKRVAGGLDTIKLDQICSIASADKEMIFKSKWLAAATNQRSYWARLYGCFKTHEDSSTAILKKWLMETKASSTRREILRTLKNQWNPQDKIALIALSRVWDQRDLFELNESLDHSPLRSRDYGSMSWDRFESMKGSFRDLKQCQNAASDMYNDNNTGADWYCLQAFPNEIHLTACMRAAQKYSNPEKADDFIQNCWDQLRTKKLVNRSECVGFGQAMRIQGNKIKQNWNCMNQVQEL